MSEMINYELAARILSGEATADERSQHIHWLNESAANVLLWEELRMAWQLGTDTTRYQEVNVEQGWQKVRASIEPKMNVPSKSFRPLQYAAASVILLMLVAALVWFFMPERVFTPESFAVNSDVQQEVVLSDGTVVYLNHSTNLMCLQPFTNDERLVQFSGEAFFDVKGADNWPFVIDMGDLTVHVRGTSFNIRSYNEAGVAYIDVSSGLVEIRHKNKDQEVLWLEAGMGAVYHKSTGLLTGVKANPNALAWKTRDIRFYNAPLSEVLETLERVYDVELSVNDSTILNERLGAHFSQNTFTYILNVVCMTFDLTYTEENGMVVLTRKQKGE